MPGTGGRSHRPASLGSRHKAVLACRAAMRRWHDAGASWWRQRGKTHVHASAPTGAVRDDGCWERLVTHAERCRHQQGHAHAPRVSREVCGAQNGSYGPCFPLPRDPHERRTTARSMLPCMVPVLKSASENKTEILGLRAIVIAGQAIHVPHRYRQRDRKALRGNEEGRTVGQAQIQRVHVPRGFRF